MSIRHTVLVFGGSGFLGRVLCAQLAARGDRVITPSHGDVSVSDAGAVLDFAQSTPPHAIVNISAAQPASSADELRATNVTGAEAVAHAANTVGARLVHMSSDAVLPGAAEPFGDDAAADAIGAYGQSKSDGERAVLATTPAVAIRTSLIWDPDERNHAVQVFAGRLTRGERLTLFTDEFRCPITRASLATAVCKLIDTPYTGVLNVAGAEPLSRAAFGRLQLEHFQVEGRERAEDVTHADIGVTRAARVVLDCRRANDLLAMRFPGPREVLRT